MKDRINTGSVQPGTGRSHGSGPPAGAHPWPINSAGLRSPGTQASRHHNPYCKMPLGRRILEPYRRALTPQMCERSCCAGASLEAASWQRAGRSRAKAWGPLLARTDAAARPASKEQAAISANMNALNVQMQSQCLLVLWRMHAEGRRADLQTGIDSTVRTAGLASTRPRHPSLWGGTITAGSHILMPAGLGEIPGNAGALACMHIYLYTRVVMRIRFSLINGSVMGLTVAEGSGCRGTKIPEPRPAPLGNS